jgi:hypothetical protein
MTTMAVEINHTVRKNCLVFKVSFSIFNRHHHESSIKSFHLPKYILTPSNVVGLVKLLSVNNCCGFIKCGAPTMKLIACASPPTV